MGKRIVSILVALALTAPTNIAAAGPKSSNLAKCNGKQRRPANPYGSILPTVDPASGTSAPASQPPREDTERSSVDVFPDKNPAASTPAAPANKPNPIVPPISSLSPPTAQRSC